MDDVVFTAIIYAVIAAVVYSVLGYLKRTDSVEKFDAEKFFVSIVVGVIAGMLSVLIDLEPQEALQMILADAGLVYLIESAAKSFWRRWISPYVDKQREEAKVAEAPPQPPS